MKKLLCILLSLCTVVSLFSACSKSKATQSTPVATKDFRVTAYLIGDSVPDMTAAQLDHINEITDVVLMSEATFDENGKITLADNFEQVLNVIKPLCTKYNKHLYINLLGPDTKSTSDSWNEQMDDKAQRHSNAFNSGTMEANVKDLLDTYGFDGVFFDYEYPLKKSYWKTYNKFIVKLDEMLGDEYKIGMAIAAWNLGQNDEAMACTDFVEIMSYDEWDDNGNHATLDMAKDDVQKFVDAGYDKAKLDLGLPFYARPTTEESYWYEYKTYYDKMDSDGLYKDSETKLTFSFNTFDTIKAKTQYALDTGLGGVMVWHWNCDTDYNNSKSLFKAINDAKTEKM